MLCSQHPGKAGAGKVLVHGAHLFCRQQLVSQVMLVSACTFSDVYHLSLEQFFCLVLLSLIFFY